jgi:N-terminal acetyltransferase B complex non-catalytic subunit
LCRSIHWTHDSFYDKQKELLSPPRAIQTAEELSLLIKIFDTQGRYGEVVSLLSSENLGIKSRIAQNEWTFVVAKLDYLEKAGLWEDALTSSRELLTLPDNITNGTTMSTVTEKDDWRVWNLLLTATERVGKLE